MTDPQLLDLLAAIERAVDNHERMDRGSRPPRSVAHLDFSRNGWAAWIEVHLAGAPDLKRLLVGGYTPESACRALVATIESDF